MLKHATATWYALGIFLILQLIYPITRIFLPLLSTSIVVMAGATAATVHCLQTRGIIRAVEMLALLGGGGMLVEYCGVQTGFPFGTYIYTDELSPQIAGIPVIVPLAWIMGAWPAWCAVNYLILGDSILRRLCRIIAGAWALTSWDIFLDPQMVSTGYWVWLSPSPSLPGIPSVPLTNYAGWFIVAVMMMTGLHLRQFRAQKQNRQPVSNQNLVGAVLFLWLYYSYTLAL